MSVELKRPLWSQHATADEQKVYFCQTLKECAYSKIYLTLLVNVLTENRFQPSMSAQSPEGITTGGVHFPTLIAHEKKLIFKGRIM